MTALRSAPRYSPDGLAYVQVPKSLVRDPVVEVLHWLALILKDDEPKPITDRFLAVNTGYSERTIQRVWTHLESSGAIERMWDGETKRRTIRRRFSLAERRARAPKSNKAKNLGPKKFGPPLAKSGGDDSTNPAGAPSREGEQEKNNRAGAADAGGGPPSSPPASPDPDAGGGESLTPAEVEARNAAALAELKALVARDLAAKAPDPSPPRAPTPRGRRERPREPDAPRDERPEEPPPDPIVRREWEARRQALADAPEDRLADLAALGDRQARAELNRRHRLAVEAARLAAVTRPADGEVATDPPAPEGPRPAPLDSPRPMVDPPAAAESPPRDRASPEPDPPAPEGPRRGLLGRLFGRR